MGGLGGSGRETWTHWEGGHKETYLALGLYAGLFERHEMRSEPVAYFDSQEPQDPEKWACPHNVIALTQASQVNHLINCFGFLEA